MTRPMAHGAEPSVRHEDLSALRDPRDKTADTDYDRDIDLLADLSDPGPSSAPCKTRCVLDPVVSDPSFDAEPGPSPAGARLVLTRRHLLAALGAGLISAPATKGQNASGAGPADLALGPPSAFSWDGLVAMARTSNGTPYRRAADPAPDVLSRIGYHQHLAIRQPVTRGVFAEPGRDGIVTTFHLGEIYRRPIKLHVVGGEVAREVVYRKDSFEAPAGSPIADMPDGAGFAGFRIHEWWASQDDTGDWLAFLGASYFRSSGDLDQYGISARGLALDTGGPEEFPDFTQFWVEEMRGGVMTIYALLEGPRVTGAFRFDVSHFPRVVMDTACRIFLRGDVARLGIAPLTSMYWYSQEKRWVDGDWRPEIHDSDGLLVMTSDAEPVWRPLTNPSTIVVSPFPAENLVGFGLLQRDRTYSHYQDRAAFERRPSLWVEPVEGFAGGEVQLVELPTKAEFNDNIVAFFVPAAPAKAGDELAFRYRLHWRGDEPETKLARMVDLRLGRPRLNRKPQDGPPRLERKAILDFQGAILAATEPGEAALTVTLGHGRAFKPRVQRSVDRPDGWRVEFDLFSEESAPTDVRVAILAEGRAIAETVVFRFEPEEDLVEASRGSLTKR